MEEPTHTADASDSGASATVDAAAPRAADDARRALGVDPDRL
jgi:hypothetical protein